MPETKVGRPRGIEMACGFGCGERLTATEIRKHFTVCPNRPTGPQPPAEPVPDPNRQSPDPDRMAGLRALLGDVEAKVGLGLPEIHETHSSSPFERSENRRAWTEKLLYLRKLGQCDEASAAEQFASLVSGVQLPAGFGKWTEARKIDWLVENVELPE